MIKLTNTNDDKFICISQNASDATVLQALRNADIISNNGDDCEYTLTDVGDGVIVTRFGYTQATLKF